MGEKAQNTGFSSQELRKQALERLQKRHGKLVDMPVRNVEALINELEVYQVELEVQNEELRRAQMEVGVALQRYQDLYDHAPVGYLSLDLNGKILQANEAAARLCFGGAYELEGQLLERMIVREDRDKLWVLQRTATATGLSQAGRFRLIRPNGDLRWVHADISVVKGSKGSTGFRLTLTDISALVQAHEELHESETKYRIVANNTYDWEFWCDPDGRFLYCSPSCERVTGRTHEEFASDLDLQRRLIHPEDLWLRDEHVRNVERAHRAGEAEWRILHRDGNWRWIAHVCQPVFDAKGNYIGCRGSNRDITARKQTDEKLSSRSTELEAANKELEAFTYSVSHDLRAPLRTLAGFSKILIEDSPQELDTESKGHLERIQKGAEKMSRLIDDLLRLSQLSRQTIERTELDLSELAKSVLITLREAYKKNVETAICPESRVSADASLMRVVLTNLLDNAWKFSRNNPDAKVEFGFFEQEGKRIYFVKDNGAGFNQRYADHMFFPFQRLHSQEEFEGTGIGLAIVERIIRRHGGHIWAEGEVGKGATIYFTLG